MADAKTRAQKPAASRVAGSRNSSARVNQPRVEKVLRLQRDAGNAAVSAGFGAARQLAYSLAGLVDQFHGILGFDTWYALESRLVLLQADLGTMEDMALTAIAEADTARLLAEVEQLKAETAQIAAQNDRLADHKNGHPGARPIERMHVLAELSIGQGGENELTDTILFDRHPERQGTKLDPKDPKDADLVQEWLSIRDTIVRPVRASALGKLLTSNLVAGKAGSESADGKPVEPAA